MKHAKCFSKSSNINLCSLISINFVTSSSTLFRKNMLRKRQDTKTYIFFAALKKERKKKLPETFPLVRAISIQKQSKKSNRYTFISFFLVGFSNNARNAKHEKDLYTKKHRILRKYWKQSNKNKTSQHELKSLKVHWYLTAWFLRQINLIHQKL
jgi:hypothetical protein